MGEWKEGWLGEFCTFQAGDAFSKEKQGAVVGDVPFIKVSDMNLTANQHYVLAANNWLSKEAAKNYRLHSPGAVVFAKIGEALKANRRRILTRPTIIDNNMMSAIATERTDKNWLYYLLETIDFNKVSRGSALPYLAVSDLKKIPVSVPERSDQKAIANVLSSLDDKIELNRRMNATLERQAQAIFRDWFVDFGPVRRKVEGASGPIAILGRLIQNPAQAAQIAALFPDAFDDDGLPVGWEDGALNQLAKAIGETVDPTSIDPITPYIGLEHMPRKSIMLDSWGAAGSVSSNKARFKVGQILFGNYGHIFTK